jgi:hypothetical protein
MEHGQRCTKEPRSNSNTIEMNLFRISVLSVALLLSSIGVSSADCSSDWRDRNDCLRSAAQEYEECLRRWSENPNPNLNINPAKCAEQRGNDEQFCRENCSSAMPQRFRFAQWNVLGLTDQCPVRSSTRGDRGPLGACKWGSPAQRF